MASRGCEGFNSPGIFTRIKPVVPWIEEAIKKDFAEAPTIESKVLKLCRAFVQENLKYCKDYCSISLKDCSINNRKLERYIDHMGIPRSKLIQAIKDEFGVEV